MSRVARVPVVDQILAPERGQHWKGIRFREACERGAAFFRPRGPADDEQGSRCLVQLVAEGRQITIERRCLDGLICVRVTGCRLLGQYVFRQGQHDGTRPAGGRHLERAKHVLRDAIGRFDFGDPLRQRRKHLAELHLLKRFAAAHVALHLADEENHRRRVVIRGMHADAGVRGPRPSRDEADAGTAGQLAIGLCHVGRCALVLGHDQLDLRRVVQRVEHLEVTLSGDTEQAIHAVDAERIDKHAPAGAGSWGFRQSVIS